MLLKIFKHFQKRSETDYEEPNNGSTKSAEESTAKDEESDIEVLKYILLKFIRFYLGWKSERQ